MRVFSIATGSVTETDTLPLCLPDQGFVWMAFSRREFEVLQNQVQTTLQTLCNATLLDLHVQDVLNKQLPSHFDFTSDYNLLVFRRLATGQSESDLSRPGEILHRTSDRGGPPVLRRIDTSPVAFVVFDRVVVTVHPADCGIRESFAARLLQAVDMSAHQQMNRMPASPFGV